MSSPYLSEIRIMSFGFPPRGWAYCNGQLLPIQQNQALFALLGTTYGGDGRVNFALPNLQGRSPMHLGGGFIQGQLGGEVAHTLITTELPGHTHIASGLTGNPNEASPIGNLWCTTNNYTKSAPNVPMSGNTISPTGGGQSHPNLSPYLTLNFCIALSGIFPSQN
jgi:microcystin-dependent protein